MAILLVGMLGCNGAQTLLRQQSVLSLPRWKDTITTKDVGADVTFSTAKGAGMPSFSYGGEQSMHAYAAHSPVFDAMAQKAFRDTSGEVGTFCTSCHSPWSNSR